ncbi:hypothetical protein ETD86_44190 [Nonomuraea turkmeniaca]|uniref:Uncharacterized protein n=1 Tax=Nonomuraea turkmeniaca TaxID=103838 RepID=A0A5S4F0E6_9ACTN|nr:hypothetical protein [Nonomuraea turkmeniaca]TMR09306.1 hypothetical protein ETD86_44190 [Nonomuraea turkmeniaca]
MITSLIYCAAVLALAGGWRRSRYDGTPPWIWWREQRAHRRPGHILGRLAKTVLGAGLLVGSAVVALLLLGAVVTGVLLCLVLAWAWWRLRCAARASAPRLLPFELADPHDLPLDETPRPETRRGLEM